MELKDLVQKRREILGFFYIRKKDIKKKYREVLKTTEKSDQIKSLIKKEVDKLFLKTAILAEREGILPSKKEAEEAEKLFSFLRENNFSIGKTKTLLNEVILYEMKNKVLSKN